MMTDGGIGMVAALAGLAVLSGCATADGGMAEHGACRPEAAAALVGRPAPDDAAIRRGTGSTLVRRIAPGDATTKDYRIERVTVTVADGRVVAAFCG